MDIQDRLKIETKDGQGRTIGYDNIDQVTTVSGSNSEAYTYDKNGNRINAGYVTDSQNRLMSDGTYQYEYDAEGNRKSRKKIVDGVVDSYVWDYRNRLIRVLTKDAGGVTINSVGYEYDADDERVKKSVSGGVVENYVIDRGQIAAVSE